MVMSNKYLNEAIIGNKSMLATLTQKGELQRLYFPGRDNRQYISFYHTGIKINDSDLIYLHEDVNNTYKQYYDTETNILNTEITNTYFKLKVLQTDFMPLKEDLESISSDFYMQLIRDPFVGLSQYSRLITGNDLLFMNTWLCDTLYFWYCDKKKLFDIIQSFVKMMVKFKSVIQIWKA